MCIYTNIIILLYYTFRINLPVLKTWCTMLRLATGGSKDTIVDRIMEYLLKPTSEGKDIKEKKTTESGKIYTYM